MTRDNNLLPQNALSIVCASLVLSGCGLKGDLYLEEPETATEQQVETGEAAAGAETSADKKSGWVERLELEKEKRAKPAANTAEPATAAPAASQQPEILTEQDELQNAQQKSEQDIGVPALEYSTPAEDDTDSSTTEAGNPTP